MTVLCTCNFTCMIVRSKPYYVHGNQCTQILNFSSPVLPTVASLIEYLFVNNENQPTVVFYKKGVLKLEACNYIKRETPTQLFSCEFCEIFRNSFFIEHLRTTHSFWIFLRLCKSIWRVAFFSKFTDQHFAIQKSSFTNFSILDHKKLKNKRNYSTQHCDLRVMCIVKN